MKKTIAILVALLMFSTVLTPALAEGAIRRIGTLMMLNMSEEDYASV